MFGRIHGTAANERRASDLRGEADQTQSRAPLVLRRSRLNLSTSIISMQWCGTPIRQGRGFQAVSRASQAGGFWPSPYKSIRAASLSLEVVESAANFFQHRRGGALREGGPICRGARTSRSHIVQWAIHVFLDPVLRPKIIPRYRERNGRYVVYLE
jgi:hypothetical protein